MSSPTPAAPNEAASSRGWIDLVLICLGGLLMVAGWFVAGAAAAGFGLVMPAVRWFGMRGRPVAGALALVPAEVAGESCTVLLPADSNPDPDTWATVLLVLFAPAFVAWEIAAGLARLLWVLCDGIALRARTLGRLAVRATGSVRTTVIRTARRWTDVRQRVKASCQEARHRFIAAKVQVRIRLRLARRGLHRRVS